MRAIRDIRIGDCRELLRAMPAESVNCVVTSPPYWGLRDYGVAGQLGLEATPGEYVAAIVDVFREVRRVLRPDGTLWLNLGDSYAAGKTGRSDYGTDDRTVGLRGNSAAAKSSGPVIARRVPEWFKPKDLVGIPWRVAFALQADGWWLRSDIVWAKPNPMPESVQDRPTKAHEYVFLLSKSERYHYDAAAIRERQMSPEASTPDDRARAFTRRRQAVIDPRQEAASAEQMPVYKNGVKTRKVADGTDGKRPGDDHLGITFPWQDTDGMRNKRSVWTIATEPYGGAHFATFPKKLVEPCILAGCPAGGVVLDPFGGSGTVGEVAEALGRQWILLELNPAYAELARARTAQRGLFLAAEARR